MFGLQNRSSPWLWLVAMVCSGGLGVPQPACGDVVQVRGGGRVDGQVKRVDNAKLPYAVVEVDPGLKIALPQSRIARVADAESLAEYRQRATDAPQDADAHFELGRWCKQAHLNAQAEHHFQRAIRIDPDHRRARASLGYTKHDGQWVRIGDLQQSRGLVRYGGRYRIPADVAIAQAKEEAEAKARQWTKEIERLVKQLGRADRANEAWAALGNINDPAASAAFGKLLTKGRNHPRQWRMFWINKLVELDSPDGVSPLLQVGLSDRDMVVREKALETLAEVAPLAAIAFYTPMLRSNDNTVVRQAADALSYFPDPALAMPLVKALITEHKTVIPGDDNRMSVSFGNVGGGGLTAGGSPTRTVVNRVENSSVLTALREIFPDANYGFNQVHWRQFLSEQFGSLEGDMRRDH